MLSPEDLKKAAETAAKAAEQAVPTKPPTSDSHNISIGGNNHAPVVGGDNLAPITVNAAGVDTLGVFVVRARPWALRFMVVGTATMIALLVLRMWLVYNFTGGWGAMNAWFQVHDQLLVPKIIGAGFAISAMVCMTWYAFTSPPSPKRA